VGGKSDCNLFYLTAKSFRRFHNVFKNFGGAIARPPLPRSGVTGLRRTSTIAFLAERQDCVATALRLKATFFLAKPQTRHTPTPLTLMIDSVHIVITWHKAALTTTVAGGWSCVCGIDMVSWTVRVIAQRSRVFEPGAEEGNTQRKI